MTTKGTHVKSSYGVIFRNDEGKPSEIEVKPFVLDYSRRFYLFDVIPMGGVRMTKSDKWKLDPNHPDPRKRQREPVTRYFAFKNRVMEQAKILEFELQQNLEIIFCVPMPASWSKKKKALHNGMPVYVRPDCDNYIKGFQDAMSKDDGFVWKNIAEKRYAETGAIIVYQ